MVLSALGACAHPATNPSFDVTVDEAQAELAWRHTHKVHLERPVVVLGGYLDPGPGVSRVTTLVRRAVEPSDWVIEVPFFSVTTFEACRDRVIDKVKEKIGFDESGELPEVDVVAFSMGGIVARYAALDRGVDPNLRIVRLFTISTPHHGAKLAEMLQPDQRIADMRAGSELLTELDSAYEGCGYEIVSYVRLDDSVVGSEAARGPDGRLWWVPNKPLSLAHVRALYDERIIGDIVRRLANETPWTTEPCAPLPGHAPERPL